MPNIQNPGSAIGEAIGAEMEKALNVFLLHLTESQGYYFLNKIPARDAKGERKLLVYDNYGTSYNIDAVIADESMHPIILIESKYIRYKKHNRDKGSWICTAHPALRRRYPSIRSSIAVLAGNWSSSSLAMLRSFDINIFLIPFTLICTLLREHGIDFNWDEKDRVTAAIAWDRYSALTEAQKSAIGTAMVQVIQDDLEKLILSILDDTIEREIASIVIELHSNLGEVKAYQFASMEQAVEFLNTAELKAVFLTTTSPSLFDPPPTFEDD